MSAYERTAPMVNEDAVEDLEKARCRRNRRQSVQFIDKNLIRRRSVAQDKFPPSQQQSLFQQSKLPSISASEENELIENEVQQQAECEH